MVILIWQDDSNCYYEGDRPEQCHKFFNTKKEAEDFQHEKARKGFYVNNGAIYGDIIEVPEVV